MQDLITYRWVSAVNLAMVEESDPVSPTLLKFLHAIKRICQTPIKVNLNIL
jgi:hypothetical protein